MYEVFCCCRCFLTALQLDQVAWIVSVENLLCGLENGSFITVLMPEKNMYSPILE